ncbi:hypothetical protein FQA39_LY11091 [Lamprigera yunnana]|nr:hypothetical protein FQA39_LY11091 [Lamprigera yunnana]
MDRPKKALEERVKEFKEDGLYLSDTNIVMCRWNSWLTAVLYLNDYLDHIHIFFMNGQMKIPEFSFLKKIMPMNQSVRRSSYPFAHHSWNKLEDLKATLERQSQGCFGVKTTHLLVNNCGTMDLDLNKMLKTASAKSFDKLSLHMKLNTTNQAYFHIGQLFCPSVAASMTNLNQNTILPQNELIDGHTHFHPLMLLSISRNEDPNVKDMLWATKCSFPTFADAALQSIWSPTSSVAVEGRRTALKESNVEITSMLAFN